MSDRDELVERQGGYCWWCGSSLPTVFAVHHRKLRKHGGTDSPANLVCLCHVCHNGGTSSVHLQPAKSYRLGFLVHSWDDPLDVPLHTSSGRSVLFNSDGTITQQTGDTSWPEKQPSRSSGTWAQTPN